MNSDLKKDITNIIRASVSAPSGDNIQPWEFCVKDNIIEVKIPNLIEDEKVFGLYPIHLSHGALIENIVIASDHYGYHADVKLFPNKADKRQTASIELHYNPIDRKVNLFRFINQRTTHRGKYRPSPLSPHLKELIKSTVTPYGDEFRLEFIEDKQDVLTIAKIVSTQTRIYFSNKILHHEFFKTIRWSHKKFNSTKNGLYIKTLRLNLITGFFFRYFLQSWKLIRPFIPIGIHKLLAKFETFKYKYTGAYCALVTNEKNLTPEKSITAGRILQRIWLETTRQHLDIQPTFASLLLHVALEEGATWSTPEQKIFIQKAVGLTKKTFSVEDTENILWFIRIGTAFDTKVYNNYRMSPKITFENT